MFVASHRSRKRRSRNPSTGNTMVKAWQNVIVLLGLWAVAQAVFSTPAEAQLDPDFYSTTCPDLLSIVQTQVQAAIDAEARIAASILRLHFHDCFVKGCDASILLDGPFEGNDTEKTGPPNLNSARGYEAIGTIKAAVESACPNVVSCADVLTLSSFYSVVNSGGPTWTVPLGRRDALLPGNTSTLPPPFFNIDNLKDNFAAQNLGITELVALSGAHTIGLARCVSFQDRLFNFSNTGEPDPTLAEPLLSTLQELCPVGGDLNVTTDLDLQTVTVFDNLYFLNILDGNGLLNSDQVLFTAANDTQDLVNLYANNQTKFFEDFAESMIKMGNLNPLTGTDGEIRLNCSVPNTATSNIIEEEWSLPKTHVIPSKGGVESFKQAIKDVMKKVTGDELEDLVENGVSGTHSSA